MKDYFIFEEDNKKSRRPKDIRRITALVLSLSILLSSIVLLVCNIIFFPTDDSKGYYNAGNNYGNISTGGYAVGDGSFVYFSNANDGYCIWKMNISSGSIEKLNTTQSWNICYSDGWIYYSNYDDDYSIYKMRTDGSENTKLNDTKSLYLNVGGGWIYYTDSRNGGYICRMDINGKNHSVLNNVKSVYLCLLGDWIYFANSSDNSYLYKIKTDGTELTLLCKKDARCLNLSNDSIYFLSLEDDSVFSNIYKIDIDGGDPVKFSEDYAEQCVLYDGYIYFVAADGGHIERISTESGNSEIVYELSDGMIEIKYINICMGKIFYCACDNNDINYTYSVDIDGKENKILK